MTSYDSLPGINISGLIVCGTLSPKHFKSGHKIDTKSTRIGTGAHAALFEPERFESSRIWNRVGLDGKQRQRRGKDWEAFCEEADGHLVLRDDEHELARGMRDAVLSDSIAGPLLTAPGPVVREHVLTWKCPTTELECKGRVDFLNLEQMTHIDAKTAATANFRPRDWLWSAERRYWTHVRMAWYHDAIELVYGWAPTDYLLVIESTPPHDVIVYQVQEGELAVGRAIYQHWLSKYAECLAKDEWPGIAGGQLHALRLSTRAYEEDPSGE